MTWERFYSKAMKCMTILAILVICTENPILLPKTPGSEADQVFCEGLSNQMAAKNDSPGRRIPVVQQIIWRRAESN